MFVLVITLICALLIAIFAVQNASAVVIQFFGMTSEVPLVLVILGSVLAGVFITFLLALWREFRLRRKNKTEVLNETGIRQEQKPDAAGQDRNPANLPSNDSGSNI